MQLRFVTPATWPDTRQVRRRCEALALRTHDEHAGASALRNLGGDVTITDTPGRGATAVLIHPIEHKDQRQKSGAE